MEDKLINCKNCQYLKETFIGDTIHYQCQKNGNYKFPKSLGILENCPLHLRTCYVEKGEEHGKNSNTRNNRRSLKSKISNK